MMDFCLQTEPKIFCILILVFLYVFQTKNSQYQIRESKLLYLFSFVEIVFSILLEFVQETFIQSLCIGVCGFCSFFAMYFGCKQAFKITHDKITVLIKTIIIFPSIAFGVLTFYSLYYVTNVANFVLTFMVVALFIIDQNNKIRVDRLTKLYNRYGMDVELKEQLRQYEHEHNDSFYIISCDLDNFKHINDTWGHLEGDRALVLIADVLAKIGKIFSSSVFRIGGDEFIIIADTSREGIDVDITNAIETELDSIDFREDFNIKMSIGVALYDGKTSIDELLDNADKKMYEAKRKEKHPSSGVRTRNQ